MSFQTHAALLVLVMAAVTWFLRFSPFLLFGKKTPPYIAYLGKILPSAIIGMLVVFCLKGVQLTKAPFGLPEGIAVLATAAVQAVKRNSLISILTGTVVYMLLIQFLF